MLELKIIVVECKGASLDLKDIGEAELSDVCVWTDNPDRDLYSRLENCERSNKSSRFLSRREYIIFRDICVKKKLVQIGEMP